MRRRHRPFACVALVTGILIIMTMVLPTTFWWFLLAGILISFGFCRLRR